MTSFLLFHSDTVLTVFDIMSSRCGICKKLGKKGDKLFKCSGDCRERFHSDCAVSNFDLGLASLDDDSVFLCNACTSHSCQICKRALNHDNLLKCTGDCGDFFHKTCASRKFGLNIDDADFACDFRCDLCLMQRSTVTPRTPHGSPCGRSLINNSNSNVSPNDKRFDELMAQMRVMSEFMSTQFTAINASLVESKGTNELMRTQFSAQFTAMNESIADMGRTMEGLGQRIDSLETNQRNEIAVLSSSLRNEIDVVSATVHNEIAVVSAAVEDVVGRVTQMETAASSDRFSINNRVAQIENSDNSDMLSISGMPSDLTDSPKQIVDKVLTALDVPELISDVLTIRNFPRKGKLHVNTGNVSVGESTDAVCTGTIIVKMKSKTMRDHVVSLKRDKKRINVKDLWSMSHPDHPGQIFINEELPQSTYNLYRRAKAKAKSTHSSAWIRGGRIYVRKSHGAPALLISSDIDLSQLD